MWRCASSRVKTFDQFVATSRLDRHIPSCTAGTSYASFHTARALNKKVKAKRDAPMEEVFEAVSFDSAQMKSQLESVVKSFGERIREIKSGNASVQSFAKLPVELTKGEETPLGQIATVAARGNRIQIVAYNPKEVKQIQTAIISKFGLPSQNSANDKQTIFVDIPAASDAQQEEERRRLKEAYDNFRNSKHRQSISQIRHKYLDPLKKAQGSKDDIKKMISQAEALVKKYSKQLEDLLK